MTRAVVVAFHNYCWQMPHDYFDVLFASFMHSFRKYWYDEVDMLYLVDSTWGIDEEDIRLYKPTLDLCESDPKITIFKVSESIRYYDAYKQILPKIKEDAVLFMDNDMVVYRSGVVDFTFKKLEEGYDVVSIYDTCGEYRFDELGGQGKFCPYWFASKVETLKQFRHVDWGPNMPKYETIGELTKEMLAKGLKPYEIEEDKTDHGKDLGYYHIRAGSTVPYLLTTKRYGNPNTYWEYLTNQPRTELLRHCGWYDRLGGDSSEIRKDLEELYEKTESTAN